MTRADALHRCYALLAWTPLHRTRRRVLLAWEAECRRLRSSGDQGAG